MNFGRNLLNFEFENEIYRKIPKFFFPVTNGNEKTEISAKFHLKIKPCSTVGAAARWPGGAGRRVGPAPLFNYRPQVRAFGNLLIHFAGGRRVPHASRAAHEPPVAGPRRVRRAGVSWRGGGRPAWGDGFRLFRGPPVSIIRSATSSAAAFGNFKSCF